VRQNILACCVIFHSLFSFFFFLQSEGCRWHGPLSKLKAHLQAACQKDASPCPRRCGARIARLLMEDHLSSTCPKRPLTCTHCGAGVEAEIASSHEAACAEVEVTCDAGGCGQRVRRVRLPAHKATACSKRRVECGYCGVPIAADRLQTHQRTDCPEFPVPCPNRCAGTTADGLPRRAMDRHLATECEEALARVRACSFADAGCQFRSASRAALEAHAEEASRLHLDLMVALAERQRGQIARLSAQLEKAATSYNGVLMWKVKGLAAKMAEARTSEGLELVSVPFFTSQCGYRLQASLFLNGNGSGEGSHISAYIKILPGEFDSILRWPFRHTVSFSLLDQNEDRTSACNVVESFIPDPSWPNFQRPSREPDQLGFGFPKFVPHEMLSARKYVRDDCIFIKIRVDPARNVAV